MISVIVPVYNVEKYLDNCVESIVNQTYKDLEIILVDDGSPDNCPAMCDEWAKKDDRIKVIHKENGGLSSARNAGLEAANGEYIAFVDSDDSIDLATYSTMLGFFEQDENVDIVICGYQRVNKKEEIVVCDNNCKQIVRFDQRELYQEIFGRLNNAVWNKIYKKRIISDMKFPNGIVHGEDLIFNLKLLKRCKVGIKCDSPFYHYYSREDSITNSKFKFSKFFEIDSKDIARKIIISDCPEQIGNADLFCFRARMNVLRSVYNSKQSNDYYDKICEIDKYIYQNYCNVKNRLKRKERFEFVLYKNLNLLYRILIKLV